MKNIEPFKGYIEISNASKNMMNYQKEMKTDTMTGGEYGEEMKGGRVGTPQPNGRGSRSSDTHGISSKVMETWINETLADA